MTFPDIVAALSATGFEGYSVDFRCGKVAYYAPDGEAIELAGIKPTAGIAADFDAPSVQQAIREAQGQVAGYTYRGFVAKVAQAGCAGYLVSFLGRRVLYYARTAQFHVELFP